MTVFSVKFNFSEFARIPALNFYHLPQGVKLFLKLMMWFCCTETWANLLYNSSNRCFSWLNQCFFFISPAFNLDFYTDVLDLNYLLEHIKDDPFTQKYKKLNEVLVGLVEDYGLVSFKTLDVQVSVGSCQNVDGKAGRINEYFRDRKSVV